MSTIPIPALAQPSVKNSRAQAIPFSYTKVLIRFRCNRVAACETVWQGTGDIYALSQALSSSSTIRPPHASGLHPILRCKDAAPQDPPVFIAGDHPILLNEQINCPPYPLDWHLLLTAQRVGNVKENHSYNRKSTCIYAFILPKHN